MLFIDTCVELLTRVDFYHQMERPTCLMSVRTVIAAEKALAH